MRFVLILALLMWTPSASGQVSWESRIAAGKAYWEAVGTPEFPVIVPSGPCRGALGCAFPVAPRLCEVWLRPIADEVVAAHEVGHCLGFDHLDYPGVMNEITRPNLRADRALCRRDWRC